MDELELLKKDWKKQEDALPKLSYDEIYRMMLKKSSSIVRWIFIISIIEFVILAGFEIFGRITGIYDELEMAGFGKGTGIFLSVLSFAILIFFVTRFYINYRNIQTTDSAKELMKSILRTRKTVKYYVFINLTFLGVLMFFMYGYLLFFNEEFLELSGIPKDTTPKIVLIIALLLIVVVAVGTVALIYYFLYGRLTRKLRRNYKELEKLEV
ncbi:hypothetical protein [Aquimarina sp. MMG016]|uniref:hypothetical protein n=1 Tax=Aquimarina sp. MMG016 TaxID=2822690 RepID=UPI001B39F057|nr:hypothetical protein [Aquimarina sp. MMG016]MBQ4822383.1 hypothetical protein [Aquimarina sp. MMG016]